MSEVDAGIAVPGTGAAPWIYVSEHVRPHVHPVTTPAGHVLTRDAPPDHPWHHALWFTIKFVDGENFWEEMPPFGVLTHHGAPTVADGALTGTVDWERPEHAGVALRHTIRLAGAADEPLGTAVDVEVTLETGRTVVLDRTPFTTWGGYGGLAFRGRPDLVESTITLADGSTHDRVHGVRSAWFDLSGHLEDGGHPVGITVLNGTSPGEGEVPWYGSNRADTYGDAGWSNFFNAAFLWDGPMDLVAGEPMSFAYRVIAHDGPVDVGGILAAASRYRADRQGR